ncbi:facilitated trehalose transporter Tret1-2 homolog [Schistocerca gregaria]|uniref:facilitated trehalose transporter Tret1-2 homolog n=1 Tax=Schistocerca gregaria TaxID=7010 RepID=UPI00211E0F5E|nr:facilitated trehalose transporter Tret1-2 homolog [Schistocerca gregaria]
MAVETASAAQELMLDENVEPPAGSAPAKTWPQYLAALTVTLSSLSVGTVLSWTSPALMELQDVNATSAPFHVTQDEGSWIGSLLAVGSMVGSLPAGRVSQVVGRRPALLGLALPLAASWVVILAAGGAAALYCARLLAGLAVGGISAVAPVYVAEIAHSSVRGTLGSFFQLMITIGVLYTYCVGAAAPYHGLAGACLAPVVVFCVAFFFMPETPSHLLSKGRRRDAVRALLRLRGAQYDYRDEIALLQAEVDESSRRKASVRDVLRNPAARRGLLLSLGLMAIQQLSGINAVVFYTSTIFKEAGSSLSPSAAAIVVGVVMAAATLASSLLMDRLGRRALLLLSTTVMAAALAVLGLHIHLALQGIGWLPLVCVCVYIVVFSLGMGPVPWLMMGELFNPEAKSIASAASVFTNYLLVFVITKTFEPMSSALGTAVVYWIYAALCAAGAVFVFFLVPETKGKTMQEIQEMLATGKTS